jgi:hypothetical protein
MKRIESPLLAARKPVRTSADWIVSVWGGDSLA